MQTDVYAELYEAAIYPYGSSELELCANRLTKYFSREFKRHQSNDMKMPCIGQGPLALAHEELADKHYDAGLELFKTFLDRETMSYTMAYFDDDPELAKTSIKSLCDAQLDKFRLIAHRMELTGDEKLINMGCGFGYFESYLLETYPEIEILSVTHSRDQYDYIVDRTKTPGNALSSKRFTLYFGEIKANMSSILGKGDYDILCSIGLLEQINNIEQLFSIFAELLTAHGRMFHHLIVSRDLIPQLLNPDNTLIGQYFPGGKVLPFCALRKNFEPFSLEGAWFINGLNYWKTIDLWHANFWRNLHHIYPAKIGREDVRYWNDFFVLCKSMFLPDRGNAYGNGQYLFRKSNPSVDV